MSGSYYTTPAAPYYQPTYTAAAPDYYPNTEAYYTTTTTYKPMSYPTYEVSICVVNMCL